MSNKEKNYNGYYGKIKNSPAFFTESVFKNSGEKSEVNKKSYSHFNDKNIKKGK